MILNDEEIDALRNYGGEILPRAVEAAVIAKLAQGVNLEPRYHVTTDCDSKIKHIPHYTPDQLHTAIAAARVQALDDCEAAIRVASDERVLDWADCIDEIRALKGTTP